MLLLAALKYQNKRINEALFISIALITVTFIIYWTLISYKKETWSVPLSATTSLTTHAINPVLGFIALWFIRKEVKINSYTFLYAMLAVFIYFLFALILYFATYDKFNTGEKVMVKDKEYIKGEGGVIIYAFLDFVKPFFYKGGNKALIILLDILMFVLAPAIPLGLCGFWKAIYKIQFTCILKQCKNKSKKNQQCNVN
ncbi:MAGa3780 family membrane protein [Mycoplasmopsis opalescens]|uniref:MAGa3780 family membrane protein n=1 Tax=Mycoplasmopsis opalescens TaxID=114886 RepID=UPI00068EE9F1|nr:hypothetical protein [Mycoplasmopsis opalescens]